jgi:signal transduction histidine kinase
MEAGGELIQLRQELEKREQELTAVRRITSALSYKTELGALLRETLEVSMATVGAQAGSILLYDKERDELVFRYVVGEKAAELTGMGMRPDQGFAGEVYRSGTARITADASKDKDHFRGIGERIQYETTNVVTVPLKSLEGAPIGVMQILNKSEGQFDDADLELLTIMSHQAALAIETARLHEEARLAVVVKLMGDISHDVKNMVTPVQTCAQSLDLMFHHLFSDLDRICSEHGEGDDGWVGQVREATEFMRGFYPEAVEMLLDGASQVQSRVKEIADCVKGIVAEPQFEMTNISEVVVKIAKPLSMVAQKAGVEILTDDLGDIPETMVDRKQLYNAIYNLVNNAIPETPSGGHVALRTSARTDGEYPDGGYVMIEVTDTGNGMPEDVRSKLFTDNAKSTKPGGTGLGTRIVKNVVDAHGGTVSVVSEVGKGSTFTIKLPIRRE